MSKKKSTQTQTSTSTTTPNVPDWISQPAQNLAGGLNSLIGQGASAFTPAISDTQKQAFELAQKQLGGGAGPDYSGALAGLDNVGSISGESLLSGLEKYYNPFKDQVLNPLLDDFDTQSGITRAAQQADAARTKAFGGSRYGIAQAATEGELARGRAATEGKALGDMYTQATSLSGQDAQRRQDAAAANAANALAAAQARASILSQQGNDQRANLGLLGDFGAQQSEAENRIKQYPLQHQAQMESLLQGLNPSMFTGQTTNASGKTTTAESGGLGQMLAKLAASAALSSFGVPVGI